MRHNGSAKRVYPSVAEFAKVPRVTPGCVVPELESDVCEMRVWGPGDGEGRPGDEAVTRCGVEDGLRNGVGPDELGMREKRDAGEQKT